MHRIKTILILVIVLSFPACTNSDNKALIETTIDGSSFFTIDPLLIKDTISLKLTGLLDDIRLVRLEKTDEALIDYLMRYYVGERYIICTTVSNGILMFSSEGKFIRHIAKNGRGPGEIADPNAEIWVDEKNDRLYIQDAYRQEKWLYCFHLKDSIVESIPVLADDSIRDIIVLDDSILYITTMVPMRTESDLPLLCQTTSGRLLWKTKMKNSNGATNSTITAINDQIYFNYIWGGDTLFKLVDKELVPFLSIKNTGKLYINRPYKIGDIFLGYSFLSNDLFQGRYAEVADLAIRREGEDPRPVWGNRHNFLFSVKEKKVWSMKEIEDDYFGAIDEPFLRPQNNGVAVLVYTPQSISKIEKSVSENPEISDDIRKRITDLNNSIDESDNPVLLIGRIKK